MFIEKKENIKTSPKKEEVQPKINTYELKKELNRLENEIIKCETKIKILEQDLCKTDIYTDFNKSNAINEKIKNLHNDLNLLNEKWEDLTNILLEN